MENDDTTKTGARKLQMERRFFPKPSLHETPKNLTQTFSVANKCW